MTKTSWQQVALEVGVVLAAGLLLGMLGALPPFWVWWPTCAALGGWWGR